MDSVDALVDHLFRREAGRMVSALVRLYGPRNLSRAEDVVQDVLCRALEVWKFRGVPDNPSAWLMKCAKNRVVDLIRRDQTARSFASMFADEAQQAAEQPSDAAAEAFLDSELIKDDQLRMMFSCCDPRISEESQVALVLNILCGFSIDEIAAAYFASSDAIEKRVIRGKKVLAGSTHLFELRKEEVEDRLPAVLRALYLLFNEGYHGANPELAVRSELCREAIYLLMLLLEHRLGNTPATYGLGALMLLLAARVPARINSRGNLISLEHQDRAQWDVALLSKGHEFLERSAQGSSVSEYHIEAAIAAIHGTASDTLNTDWGAVVSLYDSLLSLRPSAIVALNRAIAVGQHRGPAPALEAIRGIANKEQLAEYPFYWAALAEFELRLCRASIAQQHFVKACALARNPAEKDFFNRRLQESRARKES
jgi:RNA polymerase sigma factor (sigma-70 family)